MKVYTTTYNVNYEEIANGKAPLVVPVNKKTSFAIPFPSEGLLERLIVYQEDGSPTDFEVELLNSRIPYPPGQYDELDDPADNLQNYRLQLPITDPLSQTAGNTLSLVDDDFGIGFRNIDGGATANQRYLYLLIDPDDKTEETSWNVTIQCRTDVR